MIVSLVVSGSGRLAVADLHSSAMANSRALIISVMEATNHSYLAFALICVSTHTSHFQLGTSASGKPLPVLNNVLISHF
ncbi:hypothetical protein M378DRAFT_160519 [Amanita muscaria Koide BX008]|uniref:Uncharacterized protein n=1 Tax=Amanita muscaria (strain Koide BX008) TaxID=946122 RepID=A0A0C2XCG5_AMAMK|nr:hypothetical protein M378DRAFT_160519 [Amanita muscaria Koide BX008]